MKAQRQVPEWILSCRRSLRLSGDAPRICAVTFIFAVVADAVTEFAREGSLSELLYAYVLVLMSETSRDSGISSYDGRRLLRARV